MPDSGTESKSKQTILLSRLSVILPVLAGVMLFALLVFLGVTANFEIQQSRMDDGLVTVGEVSCRGVENAEAPIGVIKEYTFTIGEGLERDTYLSFLYCPSIC